MNNQNRYQSTEFTWQVETLDLKWTLQLSEGSISDLAQALLDLLRASTDASLSVDNRDEFEDCQGMTKQVVNSLEINASALPEGRSLRIECDRIWHGFVVAISGTHAECSRAREIIAEKNLHAGSALEAEALIALQSAADAPRARLLDLAGDAAEASRAFDAERVSDGLIDRLSPRILPCVR